MTVSPTSPRSSTAPAAGGPPSEGPAPVVSGTDARSETREVSFSVPVPQCEPREVECTMRLQQPGKDEWVIGVPSPLANPHGLPPSVVVTGRVRAEALTRALAVAYALHCSESWRSSTRYGMYVAHYMTEAGLDPEKVGVRV